MHGFQSDLELGSLYCTDPCRGAFGGILDPDVVCQMAMVSLCVKWHNVVPWQSTFSVKVKCLRDVTIAWSAMIAGYAVWGVEAGRGFVP